jgi:trk system potassium uptake protein TrkA
MMFVIIVGGGKTGSHLARQLGGEGHRVKLVEWRPEIIERLEQELAEGVLVVGDGSSPAVLEAAGIEQAEALAAVTGEDETNLVATTLARFEYHVPRTIARVNNPKNAWLFTPEMGVDVSLSQTDILAKMIAEEMSMGDMVTLLKLRRGEYSVVEEKLPPGSKVLGRPLRELPIPETCVIAAVLRGGKVLTPRGNMIFEVEDEVLAVVDNKSLGELRDLFAPG